MEKNASQQMLLQQVRIDLSPPRLSGPQTKQDPKFHLLFALTPGLESGKMSKMYSSVPVMKYFNRFKNKDQDMHPIFLNQTEFFSPSLLQSPGSESSKASLQRSSINLSRSYQTSPASFIHKDRIQSCCCSQYPQLLRKLLTSYTTNILW